MDLLAIIVIKVIKQHFIVNALILFKLSNSVKLAIILLLLIITNSFTIIISFLHLLILYHSISTTIIITTVISLNSINFWNLKH